MGIKEPSPSLKAISIAAVPARRNQGWREGQHSQHNSSKQDRGTHELWQHWIRPSVLTGCCTSSESTRVHPRPHSSSSWVASFAAELAQPGPSQLTAAQGHSSLTRSLVLKGSNKSHGRGTDVASRTLGGGRGLLQSCTHGQGLPGKGEGELRGSEVTRGGEEEHREADSHPSPESRSEHHGTDRGAQPPGTCPRPSSESVAMLSKARAVCALPGSLDTVAEDYKCC